MKLRQRTRLRCRLVSGRRFVALAYRGSHRHHTVRFESLGSSASKFLRCCGNNGRVCIALPLLMATIYSRFPLRLV